MSYILMQFFYKVLTKDYYFFENSMKNKSLSKISHRKMLF